MPYSKISRVHQVEQRLGEVARPPLLRLVDAHDAVAEVVVLAEHVGVHVVPVVVRALPLLGGRGVVPLPRRGVDPSGRASSPTARAGRCARSPCCRGSSTGRAPTSRATSAVRLPAAQQHDATRRPRGTAARRSGGGRTPRRPRPGWRGPPRAGRPGCDRSRRTRPPSGRRTCAADVRRGHAAGARSWVLGPRRGTPRIRRGPSGHRRGVQHIRADFAWSASGSAPGIGAYAVSLAARAAHGIYLLGYAPTASQRTAPRGGVAGTTTGTERHDRDPETHDQDADPPTPDGEEPDAGQLRPGSEPAASDPDPDPDTAQTPPPTTRRTHDDLRKRPAGHHPLAPTRSHDRHRHRRMPAPARHGLHTTGTAGTTSTTARPARAPATPAPRTRPRTPRPRRPTRASTSPAPPRTRRPTSPAPRPSRPATSSATRGSRSPAR